MGEIVRRFATRVILLHALGFCLIVALVALAARGVYRDARAQLLSQAASRQELVAGQTSRAISEFFDAFLDNLEFLRRSDNSEAVGQRRRSLISMWNMPRPPEARPNEGRNAEGRNPEGRNPEGRRQGFPTGNPNNNYNPQGNRPPNSSGFNGPNANTNGNQGTPAHPILNRILQNAPALGSQLPPPPAPTTNPTSHPAFVSLHLEPLGAGSGNVRVVTEILWRQVEARATHLFAYSPETGVVNDFGHAEKAPPTLSVVDAFRSDLNALTGPRVTSSRRVGADQYVVVAAPVISADHERRVLGVVVALDEINTRFLSDITAAKGLHYAVYDDLGNEVMTSARYDDAATRPESDAAAASRTFPAILPSQLAGLDRYRSTTVNGPATQPGGPPSTQNARRTETYVLEDGIPDLLQPIPPAVAVVSDVNLEGTKWKLTMTAPLDDVDAAVNSMFGRALFWSVFLVVAMGALLVSTSVRLIKDRVRLEKEQSAAIQRDLDHARQIQLEWLPHTYPKVPGMEIAAANVPASHVSGDLYNVFPVADGRIALVIGDVTGHGLSAAMQMSSIQLLVRAALRITTDPGAALEQVNATLCLHEFRGQFVTLLIALIDPRTGDLDLATAGHPFPLVSSKAGVAPLPVEPELILGLDPEAKYPTQKFHILRGSLLLLYTDGLTEALSNSDQLFELDRALTVLAKLPPSANARAAIDALTSAVQSFRGGRPLADDLTLLAVRFP
jgi:serine phosphatase RsbU (regulator of sigma subunit)